MGRLFVFMGKSASGKRYALRGTVGALPGDSCSDSLYDQYSIREGETDGGAYYFVSEDKMRRMEKREPDCGIKVLSDRPWTVVLFHGGRWTD